MNGFACPLCIEKITELIHGKEYAGDTAEIMIQPGFNYVFRYE